MILFSPEGWDDYSHWIDKGDLRTLLKINRLLRDILREPQSPGLGKAERLKGDLAGYSSRRINEADRLVYRMRSDGVLIVLQCRGHY